MLVEACAKGPGGSPCGRATKSPRLSAGECPRCWISLNTKKPGLGDRVHAALSAVGITPERVEKIIGRPCGCKERQEVLNRLGERLGL